MTVTVDDMQQAMDDDSTDCESHPARLVNDGGSWTGVHSELGCPVDIDTIWGPITAMRRMTGEGAYADLSLILLSGAFPEGPRSWGMIGPADTVWWIPRPPGSGTYQDLHRPVEARATPARVGDGSRLPPTRPPPDRDPTTRHAQRREPDPCRDRHRHDGHLPLFGLSGTDIDPTVVRCERRNGLRTALPAAALMTTAC